MSKLPIPILSMCSEVAFAGVAVMAERAPRAALLLAPLLVLALLLASPALGRGGRDHGDWDSTSLLPPLPPREDAARLARFVAHICDWGALATISQVPAVLGWPFANVFSLSDGPPGTGSGVPYFYLSPLQLSVGDLQNNSHATLTMSLAQTNFCKKHGFDPQSPLCAHIMLSGSITKVNETELEFAKNALFTRHPEMKTWPSDHNWFFAKLNITNIWVLDYYGGAKIVTPEEYYNVTFHIWGGWTLSREPGTCAHALEVGTVRQERRRSRSRLQSGPQPGLQ
ncbi:PREDICTED: protein CREG1, partial [Chrysochloris asiatica]|uniref:Protein CREG1 n=1 Tax=Chrysochloris asiatica TaxID=185453 RepID=A0A9B0U511_CHRAS